jgi:hypothetical protein
VLELIPVEAEDAGLSPSWYRDLVA